jgi:hypothetical protein
VTLIRGGSFKQQLGELSHVKKNSPIKELVNSNNKGLIKMKKYLQRLGGKIAVAFLYSTTSNNLKLASVGVEK